ncbi:hypothetical protein KI688_000721 [Linnemannia hyalina]|uniref:F-box domain-containing protein n=1 Tax=Linnemannia hyalina TaxID=64524 RepID=A0A9P8BYC6_9FUNG|nr:hypothetical protein KI688_000721 [Linnemannia hyalina]
MLLRLSPFAKHSQSLVPSTPSSSSHPTSPLDVPELLQHIFSFLNQRALRTVFLVCRKWLYLSQHRHRREVIWDVRWEHSSPFKTLTRLGGAERLVLHNGQWGLSWISLDLRSILQGIQAAKGYNPFVLLGITVGTLVKTVKRSHPINGFIHPLRELVFSTWDIKGEWVNSLAFPETLTSLKMEKLCEFRVDIIRILVVCPLLESLDLYFDMCVWGEGPCTDQGKDALPARLPLRSLVLTNLNAPQSWLEDLLTLTPNLDTLKLIDHDKHYINHTNRTWEYWDWDRLRNHLQSLSLPRKQLFYGEYWYHNNELAPLEADLTICPKAQDHTFLYYNLTPTVLTFLDEQPVFLTSLEILQPKYTHCVYDGWNLHNKLPYTARPLHQLLCECPNLRHLKTLKMHYMTDFMDVHRRIPIYPVLSSTDQGQEGWLEDVQEALPPNNVPGIWICRGLETLHLELHVHDQAIEKGKHHSRILYGYIATVCPQLINLRIRFPHFCQSLSIKSWSSKYEPYVLEGGLCLLSKLQHLERLWISHGIFVCENPSELNWLAKFGRTEEHRARRREVVDGWGSRLRGEAMLEADRFEKCAGIAGEILGARAFDEEVVTGLENLGLLQDVVNTVAEMDADEYKILPELFKVACGIHHERNPEKEIKALFHSPPVGLKAKLLSRVSTS